MKIKAKILDCISTFHYDGKVYKPGDVVEIEEERFVGYIMTKIDEPKKEKPKYTGMDLTVGSEEPTVTVTTTEPVAEKPKITRRRTRS